MNVMKIFVETSFSWPKPNPPGPIIDVTDRINFMNKFIEGRVQGFMEGRTEVNGQ